MQTRIEELAIATQEGNWSLVNQGLQSIVWDNSIEFEQVIDFSLQVLRFGDFQERWEVSKIIGKLGKDVIQPLVRVAGDEEVDIEGRWFAIRTLGEFKEAETILSLVELMEKTEEEDLIAIALSTLSNIGSSAISTLRELLVREDLRLLVVKSLSQIHHSSIIEPLVDVVKDVNPEIRAIAISALSGFQQEKTIPIFIEALQDKSSSVRKEAVTALGMRGKFKGKYDLVEKIKPLLYDLNLEVCQQSAIALGRMKDDKAVFALFKVLDSQHTPVLLKKEIIRVLSWDGSRQALLYLEKILYSEEQQTNQVEIEEEIVKVLGNQELPQLKFQSAQILINFLNSEQTNASIPKIKQAIAMSLGVLQEPSALTSLEQLATDTEKIVRLHAIAGLKRLGE